MNADIAFRVERFLNGQPNDEGQFLALSLKITPTYAAGESAADESVLIYYKQNGTPTESVYDGFIDLSTKIAQIHSGIVRNMLFLSAISADTRTPYGFLLVYENTYVHDGFVFETYQAYSETDIPRSFVNLHLSGAITDGEQVGGVAFGRFSPVKNGDTEPRFDCAYDAFFEKGLYVDNNKVKPLVLTVGSEVEIGTLLTETTSIPIYRYVVDGLTATSAFKTATLPHSVGRLLNIYGSFVKSGVIYPVNGYYTSSYYCFARLKDSQTIEYRAMSEMTNGMIVIEYTH